MPREGRCGVCVEPGEGQKSSEIMEGSCNVLSDQGVNRVGKSIGDLRNHMAYFGIKNVKVANKQETKNAGMPINVSFANFGLVGVCGDHRAQD